jgi:small-conductance mechanosensitive channel
LQFESVNQILIVTLNNTLAQVAQFIPRFLTGLIILLIGLIIASFVKQILVQVFKFIKLDQLLERYGVPETRGAEGVSWTRFLAELARWFVIVLFLVPTADIWGLGQFVVILNNFLSYLPNVLVSVLLLLVGFVAGRLVHDLLLASVQRVSKESARTIAVVGKYSVIVFAVLIALSQLGIASDLIRILFAGVVAAVALAAGLAFGLGGRDAAKEILTRILKRL